MDAPIESYSQEAVQQILQLALAGQAETTEFSRAQLLEMAGELGISPDHLEAAESVWRESQKIATERQEFDRLRRTQLKNHAAKFAIVNSFLMILNWQLQGRLGWSVIVLISWGMGLALDTWQTFQRDSTEYENRFQQWRRRKQLKQSVSSLVKQVGDRLKPKSTPDMGEL